MEHHDELDLSFQELETVSAPGWDWGDFIQAAGTGIAVGAVAAAIT